MPPHYMTRRPPRSQGYSPNRIRNQFERQSKWYSKATSVLCWEREFLLVNLMKGGRPSKANRTEKMIRCWLVADKNVGGDRHDLTIVESGPAGSSTSSCMRCEDDSLFESVSTQTGGRNAGTLSLGGSKEPPKIFSKAHKSPDMGDWGWIGWWWILRSKNPFKFRWWG